jgi:hypothetical protein
MSRSNPTLTNPANRRFEWAGGAGELRYYDRETKETIVQPLPFRFMVLDQLNTMAGFSKSDKSSIWANEVRDTKNDVMFTRTKAGPIEAGKYAELAETSRRGGKFAKSIYIAYSMNGNWVIGNFRCYGSAMTTWFDFSKGRTVEQGMITMTRGEQVDGGTGPYFPPAYAQHACTPEEDNIAGQLDIQLQTFLSQYLAAPKVDEDGQSTDASVANPGYATPEQRADYEQRRTAATDNYEDPLPKPGKEDTIIEDIGDEPINLDDIPF